MPSNNDGSNTSRGPRNILAMIDRNSIVKEHMWLVKCIARSIAANLPSSIDVDDLISAGTMGLIKAVDDFDPSKGASLETYARYRVRGAMLDELRKHDLLPSSTRAKLRQLETAIVELERGLGRYPTDEEIAQKSGLSLQEISALLSDSTSAELYSLDEMFENGCDDLTTDIGEMCMTHEDPLSKLERKELENVVIDAIKALPAMENIVLGLYYYDGLRMKEIGEILNISESRVSQIHSKAILLLRGKLRTHIAG